MALAKRFASRDSTFDQLEAMLADEQKNFAISYREHSRFGELPAEREQLYQELLKSIGGTSLVCTPTAGDWATIQMSHKSCGILWDERYKGYVWRTNSPPSDKIKANLDPVVRDQPMSYKWLHGNWYIYAHAYD